MSAKKRNSYLIIMAVGGVVLIVDRVLLQDGGGGPESAVAYTVSPDGPLSPSVADDTSSGALIPDIPFPKLQEPSAQNTPTRDLFEPPRDATQSARRDNQGAGDLSRIQPDDVDTFQTQHRLDGLMVQQGLRVAVVNGRWIHVNDELDGCKTVSIFQDSVIFECRDGQAELTIVSPEP